VSLNKRHKSSTGFVTGAKVQAVLHFFLHRLDSVGFFTDVPPPPNLSGLSRAALKALVVKLFGEVAALKQVVGQLREEDRASKVMNRTWCRTW
jgi:hypothetical protein